MEPFRWTRLYTLGVALLVAVALLTFAAPKHRACPDGLERSPHSGLCAVEGTDAWYGAPGTFGDPSYPIHRE